MSNLYNVFILKIEQMKRINKHNHNHLKEDRSLLVLKR